MSIKSKVDALAKSMNEAYINSISLELVYSTNPRVRTRTSEAKRYASLAEAHRRAEFALECAEIESTLPKFKEMSMPEIEGWARGGKPLHWFPCGTGEEECVILHEDGRYYLAIVRYSQEGWIAEALGARITPRVSKILMSKGLHIIEY